MASTASGQGQDIDQPQETENVREHEDDSTLPRLEPHMLSERRRTPNDLAMPWSEWEHATGDWGGTRPWLDEHGLTLEIRYTADFFYNLRGGLNTSGAEQFRGLLGIGITLDTERLGLWKGGTVFISMFENHGTDITARHLGDLQAINNADASNRTRLYEFWYEHALFDDKLRIKLGKIDANADFAAPEYGGEFTQSSAGFSPTIPLTTWPDPGLGISVFVEPVDWLYFGAGVYDADSSGTRGGFDTAFHGRNDTFAIWELGVRPKLVLFGQEEMPGAYRVGGFYHSGDWDVYFDDLGGRLQPRSHRGNAGVYVLWDQLLYREPKATPTTLSSSASFSAELLEDEAAEQGLGLSFQCDWTPSRYNEITQHYGVSLQYTGLIPKRDEDVAGIGIHHVSLGGNVQSLHQRHSETDIEVFYKYQILPFMSIKPDLHYIVNPGGDGRNALVAGVRFEVSM